MDKTVCELFAGVGGFRCGLNNISTLDDFNKKKNGILFGLTNGSHQKKTPSMLTIAMYIILALALTMTVMIRQTGI